MVKALEKGFGDFAERLIDQGFTAARAAFLPAGDPLPPMSNPYAVLGVSPGATEEQLKAAAMVKLKQEFRRLYQAYTQITEASGDYDPR